MDGLHKSPGSVPPANGPAAGWDSGTFRSPDDQLNYFESIKYIWSNPNWLVNLLFAALCGIAGGVIPVLPGLVLLGYQAEIFEGVFLYPTQHYPDFKLDRLTEYLVRGLWPFVVMLVAGIACAPLMLLAVGMPLALTAIAGVATLGDEAPVAILLVLPFILLLMIATAILLNLAIVPLLLRAVLTQDLAKTFDLHFARDFIQRVWKEALLSGLFLIAVAFGAQVLGLAMACVGILFTVPIVQFVQAHLAVQLYRIYLARGGEPIPIKSLEVTSSTVT